MKMKILGVLAAALLVGPIAAQATLLEFDYSANFGSTSISASGTLTTSDLANLDGSFNILSISGSRTVNSEIQSITGLFASNVYFTTDNVIFLNPLLNSGRYFTVWGLGYTTTGLSGSRFVNLFDNFNGAYGTPGYGEGSYPANPAFNPVAYVSSLDIRAVPEPGTLALFGLGLVGIALLRRRTTA